MGANRDRPGWDLISGHVIVQIRQAHSYKETKYCVEKLNQNLKSSKEIPVPARDFGVYASLLQSFFFTPWSDRRRGA